MSCQLCGSSEGLRGYQVLPKEEEITICEVCEGAMSLPQEHQRHWSCLHESMWSEEVAVQVVVYRLLTQLQMHDQLDMLYLDEETKAWAEAGLVEEEVVRDSNGTPLREGDSVTIIKDLPVKGAGFVAKQGTTVKAIRMVQGDPTHIQGRVNGSMIFLKTIFLKRL
jgi:protein PhnA